MVPLPTASVKLATKLSKTVERLEVATPPPPPGTPAPDPISVRIGVIALGFIALFCIVGLFYVSTPPELPTTQAPPGEDTAPKNDSVSEEEVASTANVATATTNSDAPATATADTPTDAPATANVATNVATLGVAGQIVGVLGTIAAAAVGGIAGLLAFGRSG